MSDRPSGIDLATEEYFYSLVEISPDAEALLEKMRDGLWARTLFASKTTRLSDEEKRMLYDPAVLDWDGLNADLLLEVAINRATSLDNAKPRAKKLTAAKLRLFDSFQKSFYPDSLRGDAQKESRWRSAVRCMAIDFARLLEEGSLRQGGDLNVVVDKILRERWEPLDAAHAQAIYYVAGSILQMLKNISEKSKSNDVRQALRALLDSASTSKQSAREGDLPSARVEKREKVRLSYANTKFYSVLLKIESVYHTMIKDKNVALFGVGIVGDVGYVLESFQDATGFSGLMPASTPEETKARIFRSILESYSNTRGKDFAYKKNAAAAINNTQTLRAKLAVASALAKERRKKAKSDGNKRSSEEGEPPSPRKRQALEALEPPLPASAMAEPSIGARVEVIYEEGPFLGIISSVSPSDAPGSFKIIVQWDTDDPDDEFVYPCPAGEIRLVSEPAGMVAPAGDSEFCDASDDELMSVMDTIENRIQKQIDA